jgi:hypothetical protein
MRRGVNGVAVEHGTETEIVKLLLGPLDGQRWKLPKGCYEFALHTGNGPTEDHLSVYTRRVGQGGPLRYRGEFDEQAPELEEG